MRFTLKTLMVWPPGGWQVTMTETGKQVVGGDFGHLVSNAQKHLLSNGKQSPFDLDIIIQDRICRRLPPAACSEWCQPEGVLPPSVVTNKTPGHVKRFLISMISWMSDGGGFVDQDESERRAEICVQCKLNVPINGCYGCNGIGGLIQRFGDLHSRVDDLLKNCGVCGCVNKVQVHFPLQTLLAGSEGLSYPEHVNDGPDSPACWKRST